MEWQRGSEYNSNFQFQWPNPQLAAELECKNKQDLKHLKASVLGLLLSFGEHKLFSFHWLAEELSFSSSLPYVTLR